MSVGLNVCNLLHGLASLRLSRMFHRVLDVCENQTMPMTLAQDRHLLNDRSMQVMFWYSRQKGQTNWQLYIWFHIGWNKNRSRCKVQPPFYHIFPPTSTSPPSPGGPARLLIFCRFFWNHPRGRRKGIFSKICSDLPTCVWKHQSKFSTKLAFASSSKPHPSDCSKHGQLVSFSNHLPSKLTASSQPSSDRLFIIFYRVPISISVKRLWWSILSVFSHL